eukprot:scaffold53372_cov52-Attheya_sp.AAC.4
MQGIFTDGILNSCLDCFAVLVLREGFQPSVTKTTDRPWLVSPFKGQHGHFHSDLSYPPPPTDKLFVNQIAIATSIMRGPVHPDQTYAIVYCFVARNIGDNR